MLSQSLNHLCQFWILFLLVDMSFERFFYFSDIQGFIVILGIIDVIPWNVFCEQIEFYCSRCLICLYYRSALLSSLPFFLLEFSSSLLQQLEMPFLVGLGAQTFPVLPFNRAGWIHFSGSAIQAPQASRCFFALKLDTWVTSDLHGLLWFFISQVFFIGLCKCKPSLHSFAFAHSLPQTEDILIQIPRGHFLLNSPLSITQSLRFKLTQSSQLSFLSLAQNNHHLLKTFLSVPKSGKFSLIIIRKKKRHNDHGLILVLPVLQLYEAKMQQQQHYLRYSGAQASSLSFTFLVPKVRSRGQRLQPHP